MARPSKNPEEKRTIEYKIRFNEEENKLLNNLLDAYFIDKEKKGTIRPFIRQFLIQSSKGSNIYDQNMISKLVYEINKIGVNVNQVVRLMNQKNINKNNVNLEHDLKELNRIMHNMYLRVNEIIADNDSQNTI
ncbi:mobilisation protein (MobC) [Tenacibaculum sp. MAR_2009_124]|uniref:plasmid mobilization relaxosome protein MobC n=1 Tax=Tenacibaculum sp. MAR_2009_124 TaxID=1250059 RepID=UPI0008945AC8|nr:plasmid mobilization relaxosome protein MobC [Tenacibaculum sp. MAR_2009_124]SEC65266.1 mobilisation protein (MobC) [Tenacibaculum sp. MAR_2009_124]